ncbi:TPA: hypothetical protein ACMDQU_004542 [Vibrio parahaemolyticus]
MDLYREYGKAALAAAGLENKLILLIALHRSENQSDEIFTESSNENLKLILEHRNWMVHHIARDMLGYVVQEKGMEKLEYNLRELAAFFNGASEMCWQEIQKLTKDRGINQEPLQKAINEALDAQF